MKILIIGAGGFGREVYSLIKNINMVRQQFDVLGFADDGPELGTAIHDKKVICRTSDISSTAAEGVVVAIGNPRTREKIVNQLPKGVQFPNVIHPLAVFQDPERTVIGHGNIIAAGNIFTTDVGLGNFCIINLACTIGHDALLADFVSVMPGVNISGGAQIERCAYIGTGAKLIKATTVGSYALVGAGAVVDKDVDSNQTVVGVPAKPLNN